MLSYLFLFNKRVEFDFFLTPSKIPHVHEQSKLDENLQHYHREKPDLKSLS